MGRGGGVGVGVGVGVIGGVGVGVGVASVIKGPWTCTIIGEPVLKNPMVAGASGRGGALESNRKLYNVPHRIALAFGFCAKVSVFQVTEPTV